MLIKHNISFKLRKYHRASDDLVYQIQMHVTYGGQRWIKAIGCILESEAAWDNVAQSVRATYVTTTGVKGAEINNHIGVVKEQMQLTFMYFELNDHFPTLDELVSKFEERVRGVIAQTCDKAEATKLNLFEVFDEFVQHRGDKNAWTKATYAKMASLKTDLSNFNKNLTFDDLTEDGLTAFVRYLRDDKILHTPRQKKVERVIDDSSAIAGLKNTTIHKKLEFLRWFLNYATQKGYNHNLAFKTYKPKLKQPQKPVIYLTVKEMERLQDLQFEKNNQYLEQIRDVLLFCCFSGLRHSDVFNLKKSDIKEGQIMVITTIKTYDTLSIELNNITRSILQKYDRINFPDNKALPVISNQAMNRDLKVLCKFAGIDEPITITTYKGNHRIEKTYKKYELISSHTGRRTFIVQALSKGIAPNVVMKWTGHNDYKSMRPYIDIVDKIKAAEMAKFDDLLPRQ